MQYPYSLDVTRPTRLFLCPTCGKRALKRYVCRSTGDYLADHVGRCNREQNCAYHYAPKDYFSENPTKQPFQSQNFETKQEIIKEISCIKQSIFQGSLTRYEHNNFVLFLKTLFGEHLTKKLIEQFRIGTSKYWQGATVFWQIDDLGNVRTGKIMLYDKATGKRIKTPYNHVNWVHSVLKLENYHLQQCLFGVWQLKDVVLETTICIVESEKTAVLMSVIMPDCIWLATGGLNNLKLENCQFLRQRKVILYPDLGCFEKWQTKADELQRICKFVTTSDLLERYATESDKKQGFDLADYFLKNQDTSFGWLLSEGGYPLFWDS
jgi:Domain of unknown function (DUF6371)